MNLEYFVSSFKTYSIFTQLSVEIRVWLYSFA